MILTFKSLCLFFLVTFTSFLFAKEIPSPLMLQNEFIKLIVNQDPINIGRFAIETSQGDPKNKRDDEKPLIFGRPYPWTSYTTIYLDGKIYIFGGKNPKYQKRSSENLHFGQVIHQTIENNQIITVCRFDDLSVTQRLYFFRHPNSKVFDTAMLHYEVHNLGSKKHRVGLRVMLDTMLGSNDAAPFRFGSSVITSEKQFHKKDFFNYWQTFDNLKSPTIIAQGTVLLDNPNFIVPDRILLSNWGHLVANPWKENYKKERSFIRQGELEQDTALALYWDPSTLSANETRHYQTLYGLGGVNLNAGELTLGMSAPKQLNQLQKKPFLIMAYLLNAGGYDSYDTSISIQLPEGFSLVKGKLQHSLGLLKANDTYQFPLQLSIKPKLIKTGAQLVTFSVQSKSLEDNSLTQSINVLSPSPAKINLSMQKQIYQPDSVVFVPVKLSIQNTSPFPLEHVTCQIQPNKGHFTIPNFEIPSKSIFLAPYASKDINWLLSLAPSQRNHAELFVKVDSSFDTNYLYARADVFKHDASFVFRMSAEDVKIHDYFFLEFQLPQRLLDQNPRIEIDFPEHLIELLRFNVPSFLHDQHQSRYYQRAPSRLMFDLRSFDKLPNRIIFRLHFKAKQKGYSSLRIYNHGHLIKSQPILINDAML
ncbi:MAG: hypothetical protein VW378_02235 [bacterium]